MMFRTVGFGNTKVCQMSLTFFPPHPHKGFLDLHWHNSGPR
uniref:Uncharacterized protein n=1 Tax=Anguilla anguilla TaxID=7936 RepID=A0A0E9PEK9_ANGAN